MPNAPFNYILVIKEAWSGYLTLVPLYQTTSEALAHAIYTEIILRFGHFQIIQRDHGSNLTQAAMSEICRLLTIKTRKSYIHQVITNGKTECEMVPLTAALKKSGQNPQHWPHL